jgi:hypothetical protein
MILRKIIMKGKKSLAEESDYFYFFLRDWPLL